MLQQKEGSHSRARKIFIIAHKTKKYLAGFYTEVDPKMNQE